MQAVGLQAGPPRPPYTRLSSELLADLRVLLREAGVITSLGNSAYETTV